MEHLVFDNTYARLPAGFHVPLDPTPMPGPQVVSFKDSAAELIDLDPAEATRPGLLDRFMGQRRLPGAQPRVMLYSGHQLGQYVPQLGDGRDVLRSSIPRVSVQ